MLVIIWFVICLIVYPMVGSVYATLVTATIITAIAEWIAVIYGKHLIRKHELDV